MAITPVTTLPIISSNFASAAVVGISSFQLATAIANGLAAYAAAEITVSTADVGTAGVGVGSGFCSLSPGSTLPFTTSSFTSQGMVGIFSLPLATAVANSISQCISLATPVTTHSGVGAGSGVGTLVPTSGIPFFVESFAAAGITGIQGVNLATAVANSLDLSLPSTVVTVAIVGPPTPSSAFGVGVGKIT